MECPSCNIEMEQLVEGIYQCPQCRKILKKKEETLPISTEEKEDLYGFKDGEYFHTKLSLNKEYEICEKGIIVHSSNTRVLAALICHSSILKEEKYVRISWWKTYQHAGMFKIYNKAVLQNTIKSLEKIEESFDEQWNWIGKYNTQKTKTEEEKEKEKKIEIIKARIIENRTCPNCQQKMEKYKSHYLCQHCSEIVILEGFNQPIFNIDPSDLNLKFQTNFPINFYLPVNGITVKWLVGEWKAIVVIYSKDVESKKWLRFYWWNRDFTNLIKYGQRDMSMNTQMGWKSQRGVSSPNIYDKTILKPLIDALKKIASELKWEI